MSADNHGECIHCGLDLNGERVYDHFLREYNGDETKAAYVAEQYGCRKGYGRFGKAIYMKSYDDNYNKLPSYYMCPNCKEKCYE